MELRKLDKRGQTGVSQLPAFFQIMLLVVVFAGLTFIVLDKFLGVSYESTSGSVVNESLSPIAAGTDLSIATLRSVSCIVSKVLNNTGNAVVATGNYTETACAIENSTQSCAAGTCVTPWNVSYSYTYEADTTASDAVNSTTWALYDYGIGFLGIVILVVMVYLIISIVSGRKQGAK